MRNLLAPGKYIAIAIAVWLVDAAFLSVSSGVSYSLALWSSATTLRLLFRLGIITVILFRGFYRTIRREMEYNRVIRMKQADRHSLYGNRNSGEKSKRLLYYCLRLANMQKLPAKDIDNLRTLCYCYDLGLINSREHDENASMGAAIAANIPQLARSARLIACHHEHYDGSGPKGMHGKKIPLACRIFSVVTEYDQQLQKHKLQAKLNARPLDIEDVLADLRLYSGSKLDPEIIDSFSRLLLNQRLEKVLTAEVYMQIAD